MTARQIALSTACVYLFIVAAIRFFDHKELAQLSAIDLPWPARTARL